jgi:Bax protein
MRRKGQSPTGRALAATLTSYSERGEAYVKTLYSIMDVNHLDAADEAYLGDGPNILLIPVGEGV